jgi:hypothetical protein
LLPGENWENKKHEECSNFDNGNCLIIPRAFKGRKLDPKWPACPHFKAKNNLSAIKSNKNVKKKFNIKI